MSEKILLTSFKGGTGVTTCAVYLGLALARLGARTLIVDGDTRCGSAEIIGGCRDLLVYTLADYEKGACRAKQTVISHPESSNLAFMPAVGLQNAAMAENAVKDVDGLFDFILLDGICAGLCGKAFIVTEPYAPSIKSADVCRSHLADGGIKDISLIVNKLSASQILNGEVMTAHEISALLRTPLAAVIPEDLTLCAGGCKSYTKKAFSFAAEVMLGKREGAFNVLGGFGGINGYIKKKLREKV